eukprot:g5165.t1
MFKSSILVVAIVALASSGSVQADDAHPTLPVMWTSMVNEMDVGYVKESYTMVYRPTPENPSGKWTNYTDGSCQRLIYDAGLGKSNLRFLLGCDAVDCCKETQTGNHIEYQIPNVHPATASPVKFMGKEKISQYVQGKGTTTTVCDTFVWKFGPETFTAYTTTTASNATQLHRWVVNVEGKNFTNDYFQYTAVPESEAKEFSRTFDVPDICNHPNTLWCNKAFEQGKLSPRNYAFVRQGLDSHHKIAGLN